MKYRLKDRVLPSPQQNSRHRQEVLDLSTRNLELSSSNAELSAQINDHQGAVRTLEERLEEELNTQRDQVGARTTFSNFLLDFLCHFLFLSLLPQLDRLSALEAELSGVSARLQRCEEDRKERELEAREQKNQVSWSQMGPAAVSHSRGGGTKPSVTPRWRSCSRRCTRWRRRRSYCAPNSALSIRRRCAMPRKSAACRRSCRTLRRR